MKMVRRKSGKGQSQPEEHEVSPKPEEQDSSDEPKGFKKMIRRKSGKGSSADVGGEAPSSPRSSSGGLRGLIRRKSSRGKSLGADNDSSTSHNAPKEENEEQVAAAAVTSNVSESTKCTPQHKAVRVVRSVENKSRPAKSEPAGKEACSFNDDDNNYNYYDVIEKDDDYGNPGILFSNESLQSRLLPPRPSRKFRVKEYYYYDGGTRRQQRRQGFELAETRLDKEYQAQIYWKG